MKDVIRYLLSIIILFVLGVTMGFLPTVVAFIVAVLVDRFITILNRY